MGSDDVASYYSWANDSNSCFTMSDAPGIQTQAICFSPDGEPATGIVSASPVSMTEAYMPPSFADSVSSVISSDYSYLSSTSVLDSYINDAVNDYMDTKIETAFGDLMDANFNDYVDFYGLATKTYVDYSKGGSKDF